MYRERAMRRTGRLASSLALNIYLTNLPESTIILLTLLSFTRSIVEQLHNPKYITNRCSDRLNVLADSSHNYVATSFSLHLTSYVVRYSPNTVRATVFKPSHASGIRLFLG